jgi:hypothetical protein
MIWHDWDSTKPQVSPDFLALALLAVLGRLLEAGLVDAGVIHERLPSVEERRRPDADRAVAWLESWKEWFDSRRVASRLDVRLV